MVFWESDFPPIDGVHITREILEAALTSFDVSYVSEQQLIEQLRVDRFDLLVMPYASALPKRAWPAVLVYLRAGDNLLNLGGVPFAVPVFRAGASVTIPAGRATFVLLDRTTGKLIGSTNSLREPLLAFHVENRIV